MNSPAELPVNDPTHAAFWAAAARGSLTVQHCKACGHYQFYGRPFCLRCQSDDVVWSAVRGTGTVYSSTCVRRSWIAEFTPPYTVAIVELDEGPRLITNIVNGNAAIGERVRVTWRERTGLPPVPVFEPLPGSGNAA